MKAPDRHHPADDQLIALYFADEATAEEQRSARQHLHGCEACTWRYAELIAPLEQLRVDAASEADEIFTPARLDAQRAAIRETLEQGARATHIIPFPAHSARVGRSVIGRPMFRWVAAAAAAGLLVGVSAGRFIVLNNHAAAPVSRIAVAKMAPAAQANTVSPRPATYQPGSMTDEAAAAFMGEVEAAVSQHRIAALSALDDLTPHAREAVLARR